MQTLQFLNFQIKSLICQLLTKHEYFLGKEECCVKLHNEKNVIKKMVAFTN